MSNLFIFNDLFQVSTLHFRLCLLTHLSLPVRLENFHFWQTDLNLKLLKFLLLMLKMPAYNIENDVRGINCLFQNMVLTYGWCCESQIIGASNSLYAFPSFLFSDIWNVKKIRKFLDHQLLQNIYILFSYYLQVLVP